MCVNLHRKRASTQSGKFQSLSGEVTGKKLSRPGVEGWKSQPVQGQFWTGGAGVGRKTPLSSIALFEFFGSEFGPVVPSIACGSSRSAGWTDSQLRACPWSRVTAIFRFLQNFAQIYVSLSRLFGLEVLFRGFLCGVHAFVSSSCTFCTHSYLCARSLSRVAAVFRLQNSVRTSVSASRLPWRKTIF